MTIFEKIYFTLLIINFILVFVGIILDNEGYGIGESLMYLFMEQLVLTVIYEFIRLILVMWGVSVDLFPSVVI